MHSDSAITIVNPTIKAMVSLTNADLRFMDEILTQAQQATPEDVSLKFMPPSHCHVTGSGPG